VDSAGAVWDGEGSDCLSSGLTPSLVSLRAAGGGGDAGSVAWIPAAPEASIGAAFVSVLPAWASEMVGTSWLATVIVVELGGWERAEGRVRERRGAVAMGAEGGRVRKERRQTSAVRTPVVDDAADGEIRE